MIKTNNIISLFKKSNRFKVTLIIFILLILNQVSVFNIFSTNFELSLIDFRYSLAQNNATNEKIIIVDIDTSTINKLSIWPFPRHYWATAIQNLNKYGTKVIGIDVLFDNASSSKSEDNLFARTLKDNNNVILAARKYIEKKNTYSIEMWSKPLSIFSDTTKFGFVNFPYDNDGVVRRSFKLLSAPQRETIHSFDNLTAAKYLNIPAGNLIKNLNTNRLSDNDFSKSQYYINYTLSKNFLHIPFYLIFEDRLQNPEILKDKIVLIGASDPVLNDILFTPLGMLPGVDIHAFNISTILTNKPIFKFSTFFNYLIIYLLIGLISFLVFKLDVKKSSICVFAILTGYSIISILLFLFLDFLILWGPLILSGILSVLISNLIKLLYEESEKKYIRSIFSQYVSPEVVNQLIKSPESLHLGGQKKEVTIFFSDIRSFTSLTEKYPAEQIVEQLNEYLEIMTAPIFDYKGTLDKYVGDEIMAIWGAPLNQENHAELAVSCAWKQLENLKALQTKWKNEKKPLFDMGIGINSGTVIVGNIGSSTQKDYTVIGDAVNYAARLEGLTRNFSTDSHICRLIISDTTYNYVKHMCKVKSLGVQAVKGKSIKSQIYEVLEVTPLKTN